jgi:hypothetical protein
VLILRKWIVVITAILIVSTFIVATLYALRLPLLPTLPFQSPATTNGVKTLRFYKAEEMSIDYANEKTVSFTWKPDDASNNAILDAAVYFQYYTPNSTMIDFGLTIDGQTSMHNEHLTAGSYMWAGVHVSTERVISIPNLENHTIKAFFFNNAFAGVATIPAYVKNINIILEVIDGLQPS